MGWIRDEFPAHEGYVAALERDLRVDYERYMPILYPDERRIENVKRVAVVCTCGWRSPDLVAPLGTAYSPHMCHLGGSEVYETRALRIWQQHMADVARFAARPRQRNGAPADVRIEWMLYAEGMEEPIPDDPKRR